MGMVQRRALKDTAKDPVVKKNTAAADRRKNRGTDGQKALFKIGFSLFLGFAGGLLAGRYIKIW
jgi:hypothetical protein